MGKRKSSKKPQAKKARAPLDTNFTCLFCHHEKSVTCKIDKKENVAHIACKICGQTFQTHANHLTEPIDVYSEWIDAVEEVQQTSGVASSNQRRRLAPVSDED